MALNNPVELFGSEILVRYCNNDVGFYIAQPYDHPAAKRVVLFQPLQEKHTPTLLVSISFMASLRNDALFSKKYWSPDV